MNRLNLTEEEIDFIKKLNERLHYRESEWKRQGRVFWDAYNSSEKIVSAEMKNLVAIIEKGIGNGEIIFVPINTNMGFAVGFDVRYLPKSSSEKRSNSILKFLESQTPKKYNFKKLSKYFLNPENIKRAIKKDIDITDDYEHYTY